MSADSPSPLSPWSNTTMKFNMAITSAVIAAASTMAHANASVNIVSSKASIDAKNSAKALLDKHDLSYLVDSNINGLAVAMRLDDKPLKIDVRTLVAAMDGADLDALIDLHFFDTPNLEAKARKNYALAVEREAKKEARSAARRNK